MLKGPMQLFLSQYQIISSLVGLLTNLLYGAVMMESPKFHSSKTGGHFRLSLQTALTLKVHYPHFNNFTVLFQPHSVEIYKIQKNTVFDCIGPLTLKRFISVKDVAQCFTQKAQTFPIPSTQAGPCVVTLSCSQ
jgi:hypothetical protein